MNRNISRIIFTFLFASIIFVGYMNMKSFAHSITPTQNEFEIQPEKSMKSQVSFTNSDKVQITLLVSSSPYNPQNKSMTTGINFVTFDQNKYLIAPGATQIIPYTITIPKNNLGGTFFNLIILQEDRPTTSESNISVSAGYGSLVVVDVTDATKSADENFISLGESKVEIISKGIPFFSPIKFKYTYKNNTNYVIVPSGTITVKRSDQGVSPIRFPINLDLDKVYPDQTITIEKEINNWDILDLITNKSIDARTQCQFGELELIADNKVSFVEYPIIILIVVLSFAIIIIYIKIAQKQNEFQAKKPKNN